jgi:hypothetical protein
MKEKTRLRAFENGMFRKIRGHKRNEVTGDWEVTA